MTSQAFASVEQVPVQYDADHDLPPVLHGQQAEEHSSADEQAAPAALVPHPEPQPPFDWRLAWRSMALSELQAVRIAQHTRAVQRERRIMLRSV